MKCIKKGILTIGLLIPLFFSGSVFSAPPPGEPECTFNEASLPVDGDLQDSIVALSGQGNIACADFVSSDGSSTLLPYDGVSVPGTVVFEENGTWYLEGAVFEPIPGATGEYVSNTPSMVLQFPSGKGSRCLSHYTSKNAVAGYGQTSTGAVNTENSFACYDPNKKVYEPAPVPGPSLLTNKEECAPIIVDGATDKIQTYDLVTAQSLDGTLQAVCGGENQHRCFKACPYFRNISEIQDLVGVDGVTKLCQPVNGKIPLTDDNMPHEYVDTTSIFYVDKNDPLDKENEDRCTPCLTMKQARENSVYFDQVIESNPAYENGMKFCWESENSVSVAGYKPHKPVRSQTVETTWNNYCYTTTTYVNWYGTVIPMSYTTCL